MSTKTVFISYSHRDEAWKDRLAANLRALELQNELEVWDDRRIATGDAECDAHLEWARLCRQRGDWDGLERHVARAREVVEETGYGRRRREVAYLESLPR